MPRLAYSANACQVNAMRKLRRAYLKFIAIPALLAAGTIMGSAVAGPDSIDLPGDRAFPESITSTRDGTLYVGNLAAGGVLRIRPNSAPQAWIAPGSFGSASTFGVLADEGSHILWVCSNDLSGLGLNVRGGGSGSALKGFDLNTGEGRVSAALPGDKTLCNDIAVGTDGSVYVTNSSAPEILRLAPGGKELAVWFSDPSLQPPSGAGLDGLAFGGDGNLYVDRFSPGDLYRIQVKDGRPGTLTKLKASRDLVLTDAIRPIGRSVFLLVEGGGRLDRMTIAGDSATIETLRDGMAGPTGVTPVGKTAWISEGQLSFIFDKSKRSQKPRLPFQLLSVSIAN
jgi:sugar lactone lactonase YvrE